jgi:hypothetical protein
MRCAEFLRLSRHFVIALARHLRPRAGKAQTLRASQVACQSDYKMPGVRGMVCDKRLCRSHSLQPHASRSQRCRQPRLAI